MSGLSAAVSVIALFCLIGGSYGIDTNKYRLEVYFLRFENPRGIIANGKYCDTFTQCDPLIHAFMDVDTPYASFPGTAGRFDFYQHWNFLAKVRDRNSFDFYGQQLMMRYFCDADKPTPDRVTVRVKALDHDVFTRHDEMESFDCIVPFIPTPRHVMDWSGPVQCIPMHPRNGMKLTFRYRVIPIFQEECFTNLPLARIDTTTTTTTTTSTTTTTTTEESTDTQAPEATTTSMVTTTPVDSNAWVGLLERLRNAKKAPGALVSRSLADNHTDVVVTTASPWDEFIARLKSDRRATANLIDLLTSADAENEVRTEEPDTTPAVRSATDNSWFEGENSTESTTLPSARKETTTLDFSLPENDVATWNESQWDDYNVASAVDNEGSNMPDYSLSK